MKWVFVFLLVVNVVYFGWELKRQTAIDLQRPMAVNSVPGSSKQLVLITEKEAGNQTLKEQVAPVLENTGIGTAEAASSGESAELPATEPREQSAGNGSGATIPAPESVTSSNAGPQGQPADNLVAQLPDIDLTGIDAGVGKYYCFSFGPLAEEIMALGLSDWFKSHRAAASMRYKDEQGRQLFWMYLSPQDSKTEALDTIRELKNRGISDYRLINRGNLENAVSLGLFSNQAAVNERLRELQQKGYKPIVVPYYDNKRLYWVDVKLREAGVPLDKVFEGFPSRYNYVPVDCGKITIN